MSYKPWWSGGRWSAICDRCGFRFHSDKIKTEWTGLKVCGDCFEVRHPQDFLRVEPEKIVPPWVRSEPEDDFVGDICYIWERSAYPNLAVPNCMIPGNDTVPALLLTELKG